MPKGTVIKLYSLYLLRFIDFICDLLGLKYIWYKLCPHKKVGKREPRTIMLWLLSINAAMFTIASSRYEQELSRLEYRVSNLVMQVETNPKVISLVPHLQNRKLPVKPHILNPVSIAMSLFEEFDTPDIELADELQTLVAQNKSKLSNLDLSNIALVDKDLSGASLKGSNLKNANLYRSNLLIADLQGINLFQSDLSQGYLIQANFSNAKISHSEFQKTNLIESVFNNATITKSNLSDSILIGADFSNAVLYNGNIMKNAVYNTKPFSLKANYFIIDAFLLCYTITFTHLESCIMNIDNYTIPPTKFPEGFDPKAHGMIDISESDLFTKRMRNKKHFYSDGFVASI